MTGPIGLNSERIGRDNLSVVLRHVHTTAGVSRSELAERTGLYRQTIRRLVGQLEARGLVSEEPMASEGAPGRPSFFVRPRTDVVRVLVIDVEVDSIGVGIVGLGGALIRSRRLSRTRGVVEAGRTIGDVVEACRRFLQGEDTDRIVAVGVAIVGLVRRSDGLVRLAPNLGWREVPLADRLGAELGLGVPVLVGNEADLGGLAEHLRGAAAGVADALYVSGEVGIGGGVIVEGRPLVGHGGYAGEIGHMVVNPTGEQCACGDVGCWETEVGEAALIRRAGHRPGGQRDLIVARIVEEAAKGDSRSLGAVREVGRWMGIGLGGLVNIFNPRVVVLGGLFARLYPLMASVLDEELWRRAAVAASEDLSVRAAHFGAAAPLLGAAEIAFEGLLARPDEIPEIVPARAAGGSLRPVGEPSARAGAS